MADKRIIDLTEEQAPATGDYLAVDNATNGTKKLLVETLLASGKYVQADDEIDFELPNYIGSGTRFNLELELTIKSQTLSINVINLGFKENRLFIYFDNPLILIYMHLDELTLDNKQYGALTIFAPENITLSASLNSFAICEDVRTATLAAGSTTVTFTNIPTTGDNLIDVYTDVAGLEYTAVDATTAGQLTYTFEAQSAAVTVYLVIREVS